MEHWGKDGSTTMNALQQTSDSGGLKMFKEKLFQFSLHRVE